MSELFGDEYFGAYVGGRVHHAAGQADSWNGVNHFGSLV
jgi:hypothetical protein